MCWETGKESGVQAEGCSDVELRLSLSQVLLSQFSSAIDGVRETPQLPLGEGEGRWTQGMMLKNFLQSGSMAIEFFFLLLA